MGRGISISSAPGWVILQTDSQSKGESSRSTARPHAHGLWVIFYDSPFLFAETVKKNFEILNFIV